MLSLLEVSHLFYFAGVHELHKLREIQHNSILIQTLRERVQYNDIAYYGVCGGCLMFGADNYYNVTPLDLLDGLIVDYHSCVGADNARCTDANADRFRLWMATGVAIAFLRQ